MSSRILFIGGGSIGHIAPCIAVWRAVQKMDNNSEVRFICSSRSEEADFLRTETIPFVAFPVRNPTPLHPIQFLKCLRLSMREIATFKPTVIFSKGNALSVPVALAALMKGVPVIVHESDAVSGRANRIVGLWAKKICVGFPGKTDEAKSGKILFTGNPVREEVTKGNRERGLSITGFSGAKPILLVMGGSQGSKALNEAVIQLLPELLKTMDVIHLTGAGKAGAAEQLGYWKREFVREELADLYACSSVALSRAGAGAIAELSACNIPMMLVPLRGVGHDHQRINAERMAERGLATHLPEERLRSELLSTIQNAKSKAAARPTSNAAEIIAALLV